MKIRAITLWQPYASLVAVGAKKIETRSWQTTFRGPLAIHAAKKYTYGLIADLCRHNNIWREAMQNLGVDYSKGFSTAPLPHGSVVAFCNLVDCKEITPELKVKLSYQELAFGDYDFGRYAWILEDIRQLPEPIPAKGMQGLWTYEMPVAKP